jgi:multiple sugar transport system substrate-binding protein
MENDKMRLLGSLLFLTCLVLTPPASAQTTVEWWQFWTDPEIKPTINAMVAEFEKQNPDLRVNVTDLTWANGNEKIAIAFASGTAPDVVELGSDWIAQFASSGQLADLTDHVASQKTEIQGWSMARYNERIFAKPWILGTRVLFLNRTLLDRAGYDKNFFPLSWDELDTAIHKVSALGPGLYGWGSNTAETHRLYKKFMPFFWSAGCKIFSDDGQYCVIASQKAVEVLKFYKALHDCCGYVADQRGIEDAFLDGKIGFIISGDWLLKRIELEKRKINFATGLIPGPDPTFGTGRNITANLKVHVYPGKSFEGGEFLAVSAKSTKREAALKLVDFITSAENQLKFCKANRSANPSSRTAQQDPYFQSNPYLQTFVMQLNLSEHPPVDPDWVLIESEIEKSLEKVLFEGALPGETLRQLEKTITALRKK